MRTCIAVLVLTLVVPSIAGAVVIESYDVPLPPHPLLSSGRPVLFLGPVCDGTNCPPDPTVVNEDGKDEVNQVGPPVGNRYVHINSTGKDPSLDEAELEIRDGALHLAGRGANGLELVFLTGWRDYPLALDLIAEGGDRFEFVLESEGATFQPFYLRFFYSSIYGDGGPGSSELRAEQIVQVTSPGTVLLPYANFDTLSGATLHKVDQVGFWIPDFPAGNVVRIVEIRTASTSTPAQTTSWGRIKAGYR